MKKIFEEQNKDWTAISEKVWQDGIIVFDTNVLLNLYRYNEKARDELLKIMKSFQKRLWIPYQVGLEFMNNRETVIKWLYKGFNELSVQVDECKKGFFKFYEGNYTKHRHINREELEELFDQHLQPIKDKLSEWEKTLPDYNKNDVVKNKILVMYNKRVGNDYNFDELLEIYNKGKVRYEHKLPPGYKDDTKDKREMGVRHVYGDLIAWMQIMDYAKEKVKDVIFVCEDLKEDWWERNDGKINKPRQELLDEFKYRTGRDIVIYTQKGFLEASKKKINEETMKEIKRVREENLLMWERISKAQESMLSNVPRYDFSKLYKFSLPVYEEILKKAMSQDFESIEKIRESLRTTQEYADMYASLSKRIQEMAQNDDRQEMKISSTKPHGI